jgi:AAA+ superfamily predicted ATPase
VRDTRLIRSLRAAVRGAPDDVPLRLHLAELLLGLGQAEEAVTHIAAALQREPHSAAARSLMARAMAENKEATQPGLKRPGGIQRDPAQRDPAVPARQHRRHGGDEPTERHSFNWAAAERQFADLTQPRGLEGAPERLSGYKFDIETSKVRLADVFGLAGLKRRLDAAVLAPLRKPDTRRRTPETRGGLLLYGAPGCGKTLIGRALAGELGFRFLPVSLNDLLDARAVVAERNLRDAFAAARRAAPCVLLLEDLEAAGRAGAANRRLITQLIGELDGGRDERVVVLASSETPWELDPALLLPGRLDRVLLVPPPDAAVREAILRAQLRDRPAGGMAAGPLAELAKRTEDYSATDLLHLCQTAAEQVLVDRARTGKTRRIAMHDFEVALDQVRPSIGGWLTAAQTGVRGAAPDGPFAELHRYLERRRPN